LFILIFLLTFFLKVNDLSEIQFDTFISPFLEVIKSEATDGPITARALSAIEKFISYGLLSFSKFVFLFLYFISSFVFSIRIAGAVQSISDAVTKAKFIGTSKAGIDECVLFQILQVLHKIYDAFALSGLIINKKIFRLSVLWLFLLVDVI
jgi:golgi-specific brefeldin A-resistance guanine nucleotide exchange factor 1